MNGRSIVAEDELTEFGEGRAHGVPDLGGAWRSGPRQALKPVTAGHGRLTERGGERADGVRWQSGFGR